MIDPGLTHRAIPASGEELPAVGLGTWQAFDVPADSPRCADLEAVLRGLTDAGGSVVDSSPMYGRAEAVVGDLAAGAGLADRLFLATKVWTRGAAAGARQMEDSFRRLRTSRIDLMQIHNLLDWKAHLPALSALKASGRVRYLGITHYHADAHPDLMATMETRTFDFVQVNYSLAEPEAGQRLLPLAAELGMAVLVNRPHAADALFARVRRRPLPDWAARIDCTSWAQFFLKFVLGHPAVTCVIPGTRRPGHLLDNLAAGRGRLPDEAMRRRMLEHLGGT